MKRLRRRTIGGVAPALLAGLVAAAPVAARQEALLTNQAVIEGLMQPLDLSDSRAVFRHVFSNLPAEAVVYIRPRTTTISASGRRGASSRGA